MEEATALGGQLEEVSAVLDGRRKGGLRKKAEKVRRKKADERRSGGGAPEARGRPA